MSIRIDDLTVTFKNGVTAVDHVDLEIPHGIFGLLGETLRAAHCRTAPFMPESDNQHHVSFLCSAVFPDFLLFSFSSS